MEIDRAVTQERQQELLRYFSSLLGPPNRPRVSLLLVSLPNTRMVVNLLATLHTWVLSLSHSLAATPCTEPSAHSFLRKRRACIAAVSLPPRPLAVTSLLAWLSHFLGTPGQAWAGSHLRFSFTKNLAMSSLLSVFSRCCSFPSSGRKKRAVTFPW